MARKSNRKERRDHGDKEIAYVRLATISIQALIKWGAIAFIAYQARRAVQATAGRITLADYQVSVNQGGGYDHFDLCVAFVVFGCIGIWYGYKQRRLRQYVIARMHPYQEMWEKSQDAKRSTSALTKTGDTPKEE